MDIGVDSFTLRQTGFTLGILLGEKPVLLWDIISVGDGVLWEKRF